MWPCRLVHVKGRKKPELCVRTGPFDSAIKLLREKRYGAEMKKYLPPTTSVLDAMFDDLDVEGVTTSPEANELEKIYHEWKSLHPVTRDNLQTFEGRGFQLRDRVSGVNDVNDLVSFVVHLP